MDGNPYESPKTVECLPGEPQRDRDFFRKVAFDQKAIYYSVLAQISTGVVSLAIMSGHSPPPADMVRIALATLLAAGLAVFVSMVFVYRLGARIHNPGVGVLLVVIYFVPCGQLLSLYWITRKARFLLKEEGIQVGFLGVKLSKFWPQWESTARGTMQERRNER